MSSLKDDVVRQNIAFMYGREPNADLYDPDKVKVVVKSRRTDSESDAIGKFEGEFDFLAPIYQCPVMLPGDIEPYPSFEHAIQASKTADTSKRNSLREMSDVKELKKWGTKWCDNPAEWKTNGPMIAEKLLRDKFLRSKDLRARLLATGSRTIAFNNAFGDRYWGIAEDGKGENTLGKLLEKVRNRAQRNEDLAMWIKEQFHLCTPDEVQITSTTKRDGATIETKAYDNVVVLFMGKTDDNTIVCENPSVSRRHAVLVADKARGLVIIDLQSQNRTFVGGVPVPAYIPTVVPEGAEVRLGSSSRVYCFAFDPHFGEKRRAAIIERMSGGGADETDKSGGRGSAPRSIENTVFVANIPFTASDADIRAFFESCGTIASLSVPKDKTTGELKGIAFVDFESASGFHKALMRDGDSLQGRELKITRQQKKDDAKSQHGLNGRGKGAVSADYSKDAGPSYYMRQEADSARPSAATGAGASASTDFSTTRATASERGRDGDRDRHRDDSRRDEDRGRMQQNESRSARDRSRSNSRGRHRRRRSRSSSSSSSSRSSSHHRDRSRRHRGYRGRGSSSRRRGRSSSSSDSSSSNNSRSRSSSSSSSDDSRRKRRHRDSNENKRRRRDSK